MSRLLLDTHALLWTLLEPDRIRGETLDHIRDARTELLVSAASAWEIGAKYAWESSTAHRRWCTGTPSTSRGCAPGSWRSRAITR